MFITPHALVGAAVAVTVKEPMVALPLAVASHFILDVIPHWQETLYPYKPTKLTWLRIAADFSLTIILLLFISSRHPNISGLIWLAAFMANLPDLDSLVILFPWALDNKLVKPYWQWHCKIQNEIKSIYGFVTQIFITLVAFWIAL